MWSFSSKFEIKKIWNNIFFSKILILEWKKGGELMLTLMSCFQIARFIDTARAQRYI